MPTVPLNLNVYERGANGVPTTNLVTDLAGRADSYTHTISDRYGFESCRITWVCSLAEAQDWLHNGLMRSLIVSDPDARTCWEGFLETITVTIGQKKASLSLKTMANYVTFLWTTMEGTPGDVPATPTAASQLSQSLYGRKAYMGSLPNVLGSTVVAAATKTLAMLCLPRSSESSTAATGSTLGDIRIELSFAGWYATLDWVLVSNSSAANTATNTQVSTVYLAGLATINAFLSTDYSGIDFTGPLMPQYVPNYSFYKQVIEKLLSVGDSSFNTLAYGVLEYRRFVATISAANTADTLTYQEDAGSGQILDAYGNVVAPWDVRPNAMSQVVQLLDAGPVAGATDAAARKYVARVTCQVTRDSVGCTLEPSGAGGLDAILAAFPNPYWKGF